jgi:hypothetical protein
LSHKDTQSTGSTNNENSNVQTSRPWWSSGNVLATVPTILGFNPGRGRWIFTAIKSTARHPSEVMQSRLYHVADLRHAKEPFKYEKKNTLEGDIQYLFAIFLLLRYKMTVGKIARELWWTNQELSLVNIISLSILIYHLGDE